MKGKYKKVLLPNGGVLYYAKNIVNEANYIRVNFSCGARCDTIPGLAHFTEHMLFAGTKYHSRQEINEITTELGYINAFTDNNGITFVGSVLDEDVGSYLSLTAEQITESKFSSELVKEEKEIILQEIALYADKYDDKMYELNSYNFFKTNEFKYGILGDSNSVKSIQPKDVKNFLNEYFVANNLEVTVKTKMKLSKIKKIIMDNLVSKLPVAKQFEKLPYDYLTVQNDHFYVVKTKKIKKCYLAINFVINRDRYDIEFFIKFNLLYGYMINSSKNSLYDLLRNQKNLVYGIKIYTYKVKNKTVLTFYTECENNKVNEIIKEISIYLKDLCDNGVDEESIKKIKRKTKLKDACDYLTMGVINEYLTSLKLYNKVLDKKKEREIYLSTTVEELNDMAKEIFANPKVSATIFGDIDKKEVLSQKEFFNLFKY